MNFRQLSMFLVACTFLTGCAIDTANLSPQDYKRQQSLVFQHLVLQPDIPEWHTQREKISQALGDRVFDKEFARVFNSLTVALASMGARVENMEKQSGFISVGSTRSLLPPEQCTALVHQGAVEYCRYYKLPYNNIADMYQVTNGEMASMTISLVRQTPKQTKVKLRFADVFYPSMLEELYNTVWPALDKQIFLDKGLD
jgi:hypothetical protein